MSGLVLADFTKSNAGNTNFLSILSFSKETKGEKKTDLEGEMVAVFGSSLGTKMCARSFGLIKNPVEDNFLCLQFAFDALSLCQFTRRAFSSSAHMTDFLRQRLPPAAVVVAAVATVAGVSAPRVLRWGRTCRCVLLLHILCKHLGV
jgi:hypothetical protein